MANLRDLHFDGRVVVVTGAGAGLGRAYALLFASKGAKVVVNDLGGGRHGDGNSTRAADQVVKEITDKGGVAVPDYNSVVEGGKIIDTALQNFGRVDVVVNNAGILRDKSFARISQADWDIIQDVHLKGSFITSQAAWPHFRKQKYGKIIVTSSNSGLYGNFGQAGYSAAKMALVGLCNSMAIEGKAYNIHCNVIVPTAASRLTEDIFPPDLFAELKPELIAPVVVWLCHEDCEETGSIIESAAGWASKYCLMRGKGALLRNSTTDIMSPEDVRTKWDTVTSLDHPEKIDSVEAATAGLLNVLEDLRVKKEPDEVGQKQINADFKYSEKDCILYSLGIGVSVKEPSNLKFLFEGHETFSAFPTYAVIPGQLAVMSSHLTLNAIPGREIELSQILHGEQYIELFKELPTSGTLKSVGTVADVLDKGKNAVILYNVETFDENDEKVVFNQMSVVVVGGGNFGGNRTSTKAVPTADHPDRSPDAIFTETTSMDQAAIYRLSGDSNPLHIDSNFSLIAGFKKPIIHGLCSFGFAARHVLLRYGDNNPSLFKAIKVRFAQPVYPGQTLQTRMWRNQNRIYFETAVAETSRVAIAGGYVDLTEVVDVGENHLSVPVTCDNILKSMADKVRTKPELLSSNPPYLLQIDILKDGNIASHWCIDMDKKEIYKGLPLKRSADTIITMEDDNLFCLLSKKKTFNEIASQGKIEIHGKLFTSKNWKNLIPTVPKL